MPRSDQYSDNDAASNSGRSSYQGAHGGYSLDQWLKEPTIQGSQSQSNAEAAGSIQGRYQVVQSVHPALELHDNAAPAVFLKEVPNEELTALATAHPEMSDKFDAFSAAQIGSSGGNQSNHTTLNIFNLPIAEGKSLLKDYKTLYRYFNNVEGARDAGKADSYATETEKKERNRHVLVSELPGILTLWYPTDDVEFLGLWLEQTTEFLNSGKQVLAMGDGWDGLPTSKTS